MNGCLKAFFLGLGTGTLVGFLFDLSQLRYSQMAYKQGWLVGFSYAHPLSDGEDEMSSL